MPDNREEDVGGGGRTCQELEVGGTLVQQVRLDVEGRGLSGVDDLYVSCGDRRDTLTAAAKAATVLEDCGCE